MKRFALIFFAGAAMATVALSQENNAGTNLPAEQKQEQAADAKGCCNKDCCKNMKAKKGKASKKDKFAMSCCK